jgi:hypothetical protein
MLKKWKVAASGSKAHLFSHPLPQVLGESHVAAFAEEDRLVSGHFVLRYLTKWQKLAHGFSYLVPLYVVVGTRRLGDEKCRGFDALGPDLSTILYAVSENTPSRRSDE